MDKKPVVGQYVIFHSAEGIQMDALITAVWGDLGETVNVVVVSMNDREKDPYGRQIQRFTSILHSSRVDVHGMYWRYPEDEPRPVSHQVGT